MAAQKLTFASLLCFLLPLAIGLTFPLQVLSGSSIAGAFSLMLLLFLTGVLLLTKRIKKPRLSNETRSVVWDWIVYAFVCLAVLDIPTSWVAFGFEASSGSLPVLYLAVQAGMMYYYFSRMASEQEIDSFFAGIVTMGAISGAFFVFESFNKLALGHVTAYTLKAHEYSLATAGLVPGDPGENTFRINLAYRSFGLLERHSTSALWMAYGFFAYCFLASEPSKRRRALGITLVALLIAQNFTSIFVFLLVSFCLYRANIRIRSLVVPVLALTPLLFIYHDRVTIFLSLISRFFLTNVRTVLGTDESFSYLPAVLDGLLSVGLEIFNRPHELFLGFGLGTNPYFGTSGDLGFTEAMVRLGVPLWIYFTWKIINLLRVAMRVTRSGGKYTWNSYDARLVVTAAAILSSTWLMDLHYTAWIHKSIWPMMFFAMALARRVDGRAITSFRKTRSTNIPLDEAFAQ